MAGIEPRDCCEPQTHFQSPSNHCCHGEGCMQFCISHHPSDLLDMLNVFRLTGKLCDIKLHVDSVTFFVHRVVLAAASPIFKAMFCNNMAECSMADIQLHGVKANVFAVIIEFAYTSKLCVNESNVTHLLSAGGMYQMTHVVESCCTFLERQLDPNNCIGIADFAYAHACGQLYEKARQYIYSHFTEVSKSEEFLQLSQPQVAQIIKRDELNVRCELEVYEAVLRWIKHDVDRRSAKLIQLLRAVRCHCLSPCFLAEQLQTCEIIRRVPQCCDFLNRVVEESKQHRRSSERQRAANAVIYILGGYRQHSLSLADGWCPKTNRWFRLPDLPVPRSGVAACQVHGKIYLIGGRNNRSPEEGNVDSPTVDCFDQATNTWTRCADMTVARNRVGVASMDCLIYAVGGSRDRDHHRSVERYDPEKNVWSLVASMSTPRIGVGLAVVNRLLYAVGGFDGSARLSTVECYHPENNEWRLVAPMCTMRSGAGVCSVDQYIYAVGGYDGTSQLSSVERYSVETDQWQMLAPMNKPRSAHSLAAVGNKIYAIGGFDGVNFLSSIECYDPAEDQWSEVANMSTGRSGHGTAVGLEPCAEFLIDRPNISNL